VPLETGMVGGWIRRESLACRRIACPDEAHRCVGST